MKGGHSLPKLQTVLANYEYGIKKAEKWTQERFSRNSE